MKHVIVLNEHACRHINVQSLILEFEKAFENLDYFLYKTTNTKSATYFLRNYIAQYPDETIRVYACGGDGTIQEVINGVFGSPNVEVAIYPCGTGNDFVKYYPCKEFLNINKLITSGTSKIDLSKITADSLSEPQYSMNVINFGFDAIVGEKGNKNKEKGIKNPYGKAIKSAILKARFNRIIVTADHEQLNKKTLLLCSLAQGKYVGGKYLTAPLSENNDGFIDVCLIKCLSLVKLSLLIKKYTNGEHLKEPNPKIIYRKAKTINIDGKKPFIICADGEIIKGSHFQIDVVPNAIKLVIPE